MTVRLAVATYDQIPELMDEDLELGRALAALEVEIVPWVWTLPRPEAIDAVLIRSCWDYHHASDAFDAWLDGLEHEGLPVANAPATLRWNKHKAYLLELEARGVCIPATRMVRRGESPAAALEALAGGPLVVKPAISMGGWETHRFGAAEGDAAHACATRLAASRDVLVQAYRPEIEHGEVSIILFDGAPSHAVLKRPASGEFRVHGEHGGTRELIEPDARWVEDAVRITALAPQRPLIARVDGVIADGQLVLMELEAIDPMLSLEWAPPERTTRLAEAIRTWLDAAR